MEQVITQDNVDPLFVLPYDAQGRNEFIKIIGLTF